MLDDSKAIAARDIVNEPDAVYLLNRAYVIISDSSVNATFSNMTEAINILYDLGWVAVDMSYDSSYMFTLMHNTNYKRKNHVEHATDAE